MLELLQVLWAFDHAMAVRARPVARRFGITGSQRLVLRIVGEQPGLSAGDVARILHVHPSTLTAVLQSLAARGLLRREPAPDDRRRAVLRLSPRGARIDAGAVAEIERPAQAALARLPEAQVRAAREVLAALTAALAPLGRARAAPRRIADGAGTRAAARERVPARTERPRPEPARGAVAAAAHAAPAPDGELRPRRTGKAQPHPQAPGART